MTTGYGKKFYRVDEVAQMFSFSKDHVYDLVHRGKLIAWHSEQTAGRRGIRITAESVQNLEKSGFLSPDQFNE